MFYSTWYDPITTQFALGNYVPAITDAASEGGSALAWAPLPSSLPSPPGWSYAVLTFLIPSISQASRPCLLGRPPPKTGERGSLEGELAMLVWKSCHQTQPRRDGPEDDSGAF